MSTLRVNNITARTGTGTVTVPSGNVLYAPGHIIQVQYAYWTGIQSLSGATWVDLSGAAVTITPQKANSVIRIECVQHVGVGSGDPNIGMRFTRNNTPLPDLPTGIGNRVAKHAGSYVWTTANDANTCFAWPAIAYDSPNTTSALTYRLQVNNAYNGTITFGSSTNNADASYSSRYAQYITVMEIAQ